MLVRFVPRLAGLAAALVLLAGLTACSPLRSEPDASLPQQPSAVERLSARQGTPGPTLPTPPAIATPARASTPPLPPPLSLTPPAAAVTKSKSDSGTDAALYWVGLAALLAIFAGAVMFTLRAQRSAQ